MLCRYERTIFKSDKGFCIFSYSTEDQSVPKEAHNRSFYHDDKIHFTAIGYHLVASNAVEVELDGTWENSKHGLQLSVSILYDRRTRRRFPDTGLSALTACPC